MRNKLLLDFPDFYRLLAESCFKPYEFIGLPALLKMHGWSVEITDHGELKITVQDKKTHVEDAYKIFTKNVDFFEDFYKIAVKLAAAPDHL